MKIYIVRHGQVNSNIKGVYNTKDEDLTDVGVKQALETREKMKGINFDIVYSSPLKRAKHTAEIVTNGQKEIVFDNRLEERDCGSLCGQPLEVTDREEYWNYYSTIQYGTSENVKEFFNRVFSFLDEIKTEKYDSVLVVAHSGVSKAFSAYFEGIQDGLFWNRGIKNCEIKEYEL